MRVWYTNEELAFTLDQVADLLFVRRSGNRSREHARARSFRRAAEHVRTLESPVRSILLTEGVAGVARVAAVSHWTARSLKELVETGRLAYLEHLERTATPAELFSTVEGVGVVLAERLQRDLGVASLEELQDAARWGRLESLPGVGPQRARAIDAAVQQRLQQSGERRLRRVLGELGVGIAPQGPRPSVATLLEVDTLFLVGVDAGALPDLARNVASAGDAACGSDGAPVLSTTRDGWTLTAKFSNTERACRLQTTRDWVVITFEAEGQRGEAVVVTETHGPYVGRRVVRGREAECRQHDARGVSAGAFAQPRPAPAPPESLWLPGFDNPA
jgi:hypothetical protein